MVCFFSNFSVLVVIPALRTIGNIVSGFTSNMFFILLSNSIIHFSYHLCSNLIVERERLCKSSSSNLADLLFKIFLAYVFWFAGCYQQSGSSSYPESSHSWPDKKRHCKRSMLDNLQYCCRDQRANSGGNGFGFISFYKCHTLCVT